MRRVCFKHSKPREVYKYGRLPRALFVPQSLITVSTDSTWTLLHLHGLVPPVPFNAARHA